MSHACSILVFDLDMSKQKIQDICYAWQQSHADPEESGWDGPRMKVYWTSRSFQTYSDAAEYLEDTFGDYSQTAVSFKDDNGKMMWAIACEVHC